MRKVKISHIWENTRMKGRKKNARKKHGISGKKLSDENDPITVFIKIRRCSVTICEVLQKKKQESYVT